MPLLAMGNLPTADCTRDGIATYRREHDTYLGRGSPCLIITTFRPSDEIPWERERLARPRHRRQSAQQEAERAIREHDVISLSVRDSQRFADLVLSPPEPNDHLQAAMKRHRSDVQSDV